MPESDEGRKLHEQAEIARENGEFLKALEFTDQATLAYQKDGDLLGLAEIQASRQITFKHLYRNTHNPAFLILEKHSAEAAVEIAEQSNLSQALAIPYHNLGKYYFEAKDYINAVKYFKLAIENLSLNPPQRHNRPAIAADIKGHLFAAEYQSGDKSALDRALDALNGLENSDEDSYNKNVWLSGAHLRISEMLKLDNPNLSKKHIEAAEKIINSDKRLILRKNQLEELKKNRN